VREDAGLPAQLDGLRVRGVEPRLVQADVGADLPGEQRMLVGRVVADEQHRRRAEDVAHRRRRAVLPVQCGGQSREVGGAVVVDVVGAEHHARELLQQVGFFVRGPR
jgi:hypothetical protein